MAKKNGNEQKPEGVSVFRFTLMGLVFFSAALVLAGGLLGSGLMPFRAGKSSVPAAQTDGNASRGAGSQENPLWGDLRTFDIWVERPEEYVADEAQTNQPTVWKFDKLSVEKVRELMLKCGLTPTQVSGALSSGHVAASADATTVQPEDDLVFALSPEVRAALYTELARCPANRYITTPFIFQGQTLDEWFSGGEVDASAAAQARKLIYRRGAVQCFSDLEVMMRALPTQKQRVDFVKAISRQPAVLLRLQIRPDTDVDKVLGYWSRGAQAKDARPLLDSLKRLPGGGTASVLYLLPPFARERLFTFPKMPAPGQPGEDCHWTTMNFFNETPDNRFANADYTVRYLQEHYYPVAKPTLYGDVVLVMQGENNVIHTAVYLADDIVFTKNGNNIRQPWTLMRIKDLLKIYDFGTPIRLAYYRHNNW